MLGIGKCQGTVRTKKIPKDTRRHELRKVVKETVSAGDLLSAVRLPSNENVFEWIATNTILFYNQINTIDELTRASCTEASCPVMSAGQGYEYLWADGKNVKKPVQVSAPRYFEYLMDWTQRTIEDTHVFPATMGTEPPKQFLPTVKQIFRKLFRVYAHMYWSHYDQIEKMGVAPHLNTGFTHFYLFTREFSLVDPKEMAPLESVISQICREYGLKP